jgi:outer membrane protein assembly factor BamB
MDTQNNERFMPETIDEQVDRLSQMRPITSAARVVHELSALYKQDARILEGAWQRLEERAVSMESGSTDNFYANEKIDGQRSQQERKRHMDGTVSQRRDNKRFPRIISMIAATLIVAIVVGSLIFVLNAVRQGKTTTVHHNQTHVAAQGSPHTTYDQAGLYVTLMDGVYRVDAKSGKILWHYFMNPFMKGRNGSESNRVESDLTIVNGSVYFGGNDDNGHYLYSLKTTNGSLLWRKQLDYPLTGTPKVVNGVIYVGTSDGTAADQSHIYALDAHTGAILWSHSFNFRVAVNVIDHGTIYASSFKMLLTLNASDGKPGWTSKALPSDQYFSSLQLVDGVLYASSSGGSQYCYEYAYDPTVGKQLWRSEVVNGFVTSAPTISGDSLYFGSQNGYVYALNTKDGKQRWSYNAGVAVYPSPQVADGIVYIGETSLSRSNDSIIALNAATGKHVWSKTIFDYFGQTQLLVNNGILYVPSDDGVVHLLKISDGSQIQSYKFSKGPASFDAPALTLVQ